MLYFSKYDIVNILFISIVLHCPFSAVLCTPLAFSVTCLLFVSVPSTVVRSSTFATLVCLVHSLSLLSQHVLGPPLSLICSLSRHAGLSSVLSLCPQISVLSPLSLSP